MDTRWTTSHIRIYMSGSNRTQVHGWSSGRLNYRQASQQSKTLQQQLEPLFNKKVYLLFHSDKYHFVSESLKRIVDELFIQIKNLYETSIDKLTRDIEIIRRLIPKEPSHLEKSLDEVLQEYRNLYQGFTDDYINFYEKEKERHDEMMVEIQELLEAARMGLTQNQAAASDSETAATSYSFFPAGR